MARKKKITKKPASTVSSKRYSRLVASNRNSLIAGTLAVVFLLGLVFAINRSKNHNAPLPPMAPKAPSVNISTTATPSASIAPTTTNATASAMQAGKNATGSAPVKKLPFTSSDRIFYTVKNGDSVARIGNRLCNDKRAWLYIEQDNNLVEPYSLQPGDTLIISCR